MRMKAILRRIQEGEAEIDSKSSLYKIGRLTFDYTRQLLTAPSGETKLTSKEAELLRLLCDNANGVLDRSVALNRICRTTAISMPQHGCLYHEAEEVPEGGTNLSNFECAWDRFKLVLP